MKQIDTRQWKPFKIGNIFQTRRVMGKLQVPTGASVPKKSLRENGNTPRITVTGLNNGTYGMYDYCGKNPNNYRVYTNFISVSFLGTVFYQKGTASLDMKVHCLKPVGVELDEYTGLFLVAAINSSLRKSSYLDQLSSSLLPKLVIMLPSTPDGNPDFTAMEKFVRERERRAKVSLDALSVYTDAAKQQVDSTKWKRFHLYDESLFTIDSGTKLDRVKMSSNCPTVNFVGRANANNGVTCAVDRIAALPPYEAGLLTISLGGYVGSCFVQDRPFYTSQNVNVLIPRKRMSVYAKMFIATVVFREGQLHYKAFSNELNRHMKRDFSIPLPVASSGAPDFEYMERHMKAIEEKVKSKLTALQSI